MVGASEKFICSCTVSVSIGSESTYVNHEKELPKYFLQHILPAIDCSCGKVFLYMQFKPDSICWSSRGDFVFMYLKNFTSPEFAPLYCSRHPPKVFLRKYVPYRKLSILIIRSKQWNKSCFRETFCYNLFHYPVL